MIAFASFSQTTKDTICVDRDKFVRMLTKAEQAKGLEQQRDLLFNQVDTLKARISIKDMQLINLSGQISDYKNIITSKDAIISTQSEQKKILDYNAAVLSKELKKQKRKTRLTAFVGLLTTGIVSYLFISK